MKTTVWIRIDVEVDPGAEDPFAVVDDYLDFGELQEEINITDGLKVVSALSLDTASVVESLKTGGAR